MSTNKFNFLYIKLNRPLKRKTTDYHNTTTQQQRKDHTDQTERQRYRWISTTDVVQMHNAQIFQAYGKYK